MATPREHIEEIRKTKFSIGGEPNPLTEDLHQAVMNLSGELYAKDVHFLMELIQNAEDNEYLEGVDPSLEFVVTSRDITATGAPATLLIFNNERGFTPRNIDSICSVGRSTKKGNRRRGYIGEKVADTTPPSILWIPSGTENGQWVSSEDCVIHDKNGLLGSRLHVLEQHYEVTLLSFFSITYGVKMNPSIDDYCEIWKSWEVSGHQVTHDESCAFWEFVVKNWSSRTEETLAQQLMKVPVYSGSSTTNLGNKHDVFIADDLQLKDLFEKSSFGSLFVWYPQPSMKSLPRTKLLEIYSKIGVRSISKSVKQELSAVNTINLKQLNPKETFIGKGLVRLILGFLIEISPKMEADSRYDVVRRLLDVTVFEAGEPITMSYALSLSSGKILNVEARQMLRWERQNSKLFVQKLDKDGGHKNIIEYASHFSEVVAGGLLWENEDHMLCLTELIRLGFLVEFNEEAVKYLMKTENLQIFLEDEEFLSSSFPDN